MTPGLSKSHLEVNPSENKYFRHLNTGPPSGNLRGLDALPHPQMQTHQSLTATSVGDADLSQENVRAAGHLPGPPLLGPCPSSLAAPTMDRTFLKAGTTCQRSGARKAREGPWSSRSWESLLSLLPPPSLPPEADPGVRALAPVPFPKYMPGPDLQAALGTPRPPQSGPLWWGPPLSSPPHLAPCAQRLSLFSHSHCKLPEDRLRDGGFPMGRAGPLWNSKPVEAPTTVGQVHSQVPTQRPGHTGQGLVGEQRDRGCRGEGCH